MAYTDNTDIIDNALLNDRMKVWDDIAINIINRLDTALEEYKARENIEDYSGITQNQWMAALMFVGKLVFADKSPLKYTNDDKTLLDGIGFKYISINNIYNPYIMDKLADYYIFLCTKYDKGVTPYCYIWFTNIDQNTFYSWNEETENARGAAKGPKLSPSFADIVKKVYATYEQSAENKLWTNKNPVAVMAITNRRFGWNMPGVGRDSRGRSALGAAELPQLDEKP